MKRSIFIETTQPEEHISALEEAMSALILPFRPGDKVGIKLHWGEKGNRSYLAPQYARTVACYLKKQGILPAVIDTTVLYSGGRRNGADSLQTARTHGFSEAYLGCPVEIADGLDGRDVMDIDAGYGHFKSVQVARAVHELDGFIILSHFKGHIVAGFAGAIKNISMGLASRAQKQRMHSDAGPALNRRRCTKCGACIDVCPVGAARVGNNLSPVFDLKTCIGCAQCIAMCPEVALKIQWGTDQRVFQEKLVETAAAIWRLIEKKTVLINLLFNITANCDCMSGRHSRIAPDRGVVGGYHPVAVDEESIKRIEAGPFDRAHPGVPWRHQFDYAYRLGFKP